MFLFVLLDDDGDGVAEEDCATPPPSKYDKVTLFHFSYQGFEIIKWNFETIRGSLMTSK